MQANWHFAWSVILAAAHGGCNGLKCTERKKGGPCRAALENRILPDYAAIFSPLAFSLNATANRTTTTKAIAAGMSQMVFQS
jgi:hypothetical protein